MKVLIVFMLVVVFVSCGIIPDVIKDNIPEAIKNNIPNPFACSEGKTFLTQGPVCELTCENLLNLKNHIVNKINPLCMAKRPGCFCTDGYILRESDNTCISKTYCLGTKMFG